jgi:hypothetical protein
MYLSVDYLAGNLQRSIHSLLQEWPALVDVVQWSGVDHDALFIAWVLACYLVSAVVTRGILYSIAHEPDPMSKYVGAIVLLCAPTPFLLMRATWFDLLVADVLHLALQAFGWWFWWGTQVPEDRVTDAREVWKHIGEQKEFNPLDHMRTKQGVFVGLNDQNNPTFLTLQDAHRHVQIIGQTRSGKNVAVATLLEQSVRLGECVIVFDPKSDFYMPAIMAASAKRNGVPFTFIDLRPDQPPQMNLLADCAPHELEELLIQGFDLLEKGDNADVYRTEDRAAVRALAASGVRSFPELLEKASALLNPTKNRRLAEALNEVGCLPVIQTDEGVDLSRIVAQPGIIYVVGSTRAESVVRLQRMVLLRVIQLIDIAGQKREGIWSSLFLDELKYLLCPAALQALGVIADRRCALRVAHQGLGDLDDTSMSGFAVRSAVLVNCAIKFLFRTNDPETATWMARLTGSVSVFANITQKTLFKFAKRQGNWRESMSTLFDQNVFLSLPPLHAVMVGAGVPVKIHVGYLPVGERPTPNAAPHRLSRLQEVI